MKALKSKLKEHLVYDVTSEASKVNFSRVIGVSALGL